MIDAYYLYVQADGDTGDSAHRSGLAYAIKGLLGITDNKLRKAIIEVLQVSPGVYVRHPRGVQKWHSDPQTFSRDQASRVVLGLAVNGDKEALKSWFKQLVSRRFLHQNNKDFETGKWKLPDVVAPGEFRNVIRGLDAWYAYPILVALDALFIVDIFTRSSWDGGSLFIPDIKYAKKKYPTPFAYIADFVANKTNVYKEIDSNHSIEHNGCTELQPLFKRLAKEL